MLTKKLKNNLPNDADMLALQPLALTDAAKLDSPVASICL